MDYFKILHFSREPFSNSPDPGFFYKAQQHVSCLQNLEISIRLRRGVNVVLGQVGTGKTTLCRRLIASLDDDESVESYLIFDPYFGTPLDFLLAVAGLFRCTVENEKPTEWDVKESIKNFLFQKGVDEDRTVVLVIDEGQKIPDFCLEILREFLNYETNDAKLLQVVIFAQTEFEKTLDARPNFSDRLNLLLKLGPLSFRETREMIRYRLNRASERGRASIKFTYPAVRTLYKATGGYPRKIIHICHRVILSLILQNKTKAGYSLVKACAARETATRPGFFRWAFVVALVAALGIWGAFRFRLIPEGMIFYRTQSAAVSARPAERASIDFTAKIPAEIPAEVPTETSTEVPADKPAGNPAEIPAEEEKFAAFAEPLPDEPPLEEKATPPPAPEKPPAPIPEFLGRIAVKSNDTLSAMVGRVYGILPEDMVWKVAEANPHIKNVNQIRLGQLIAFPVINPTAEGKDWDGFAVRVAETTSLGDAYRFILSSPAVRPPMRIITIMAEDGTMNYNIILSRRYGDEDSARAAMKTLPPELARGAELFDGPSPGAVMLTKWE
jgi:general secretion pathway protein A